MRAKGPGHTFSAGHTFLGIGIEMSGPTLKKSKTLFCKSMKYGQILGHRKSVAGPICQRAIFRARVIIGIYNLITISLIQICETILTPLSKTARWDH